MTAAAVEESPAETTERYPVLHALCLECDTFGVCGCRPRTGPKVYDPPPELKCVMCVETLGADPRPLCPGCKAAG